MAAIWQSGRPRRRRGRPESVKMRVGCVCVRRDRKAMQAEVGAKQRMITVSGSISFFHSLQKIQRPAHDFGNNHSAKNDLPRRKRGNAAGQRRVRFGQVVLI